MIDLLPVYIGIGMCVAGVALALFGHRGADAFSAFGATLTGGGILWQGFGLKNIFFAGLCFGLALVVIVKSSIEERKKSYGEQPQCEGQDDGVVPEGEGRRP